MSDLMDKERLLKGNGLSFTTQEYITPQGSESMGLIIGNYILDSRTGVMYN